MNSIIIPHRLACSFWLPLFRVSGSDIEYDMEFKISWWVVSLLGSKEGSSMGPMSDSELEFSVFMVLGETVVYPRVGSIRMSMVSPQWIYTWRFNWYVYWLVNWPFLCQVVRVFGCTFTCHTGWLGSWHLGRIFGCHITVTCTFIRNWHGSLLST